MATGTGSSDMANDTGMRKMDFPVDVKDLVKEMFTKGYKFPKQDTDDDLKVNISKNVSFGDIKDASSMEPQNEVVGGTIIGYISTVRKFFPGQYKLSVIHLYGANDPLVIFHHEAVDPNLLAIQVILLSKDYCAFHRDLHNSINRYDWFHWTYWGPDIVNDEDSEYDEEQVNPLPKNAHSKANNAVISLLQEKFQDNVTPKVQLPNENNSEYLKTIIYFNKTEKADQLKNFILKNQIKRSATIKYLFSVQDDDGETVSLGVYFTPFNSGDWVFAKAFEDSATGSYFALVVSGYLDLSEEPWKEKYDAKERKNLNFATVNKTQLKFPMTEFTFKDN